MLLFVKHLINSVVSFSWSLCRKSAALLARRTKSSSFSEKSNISNGSLTLGGRRTPSSRSSTSFAWSWKRYTFIWMFSRPLMLNSISSALTGDLELNLVARNVDSLALWPEWKEEDRWSLGQAYRTVLHLKWRAGHQTRGRRGEP